MTPIRTFAPQRAIGATPARAAAPRSTLPRVFVFALALLAVAAAPITQAEARPAPDGFADLAERLSPAVVNISTTQTVSGPNRQVPNLPDGNPFKDFFEDFFDRDGQGGERKAQSLGSGFVIDPDGYVVTNNHVIEGADEIEVNFVDGRSLPAELIGRDAETDLALLKIDADESLPFVPWGDSRVARVGDWVIAIGNPFGLGGSVSAGIISARNRNINSGRYDDFIQTDAAINKGNSGGPLFNMAGEVIGVNTAIFSPTGGSVGIGFSVPSALAEVVVGQLREFGETRRGWLGVQIQNVDDVFADSLGLDRAIGAFVQFVDPAGPAFAGGVEQGDVIVGYDGREVTEMRDLPRMVAETKVGRQVEVEVFRKGRYETLDVTIALLDETEARVQPAAVERQDEPTSAKVIGMVFEPISAENRQRYQIDRDVEGVVIVEIDGASSAFERGVRQGDVLVEVAQESVVSPADAEEKITDVRESGRRSVLLMLNRGGDLRFVAVEFDN